MTLTMNTNVKVITVAIGIVAILLFPFILFLSSVILAVCILLLYQTKSKLYLLFLPLLVLVFALCFSDVIIKIAIVSTMAVVVGFVIGCTFSHYQFAILVAIVVSSFGILSLPIIEMKIYSQSPTQYAKSYIENNQDTFIVKSIGELYYYFYDGELNVNKFTKEDESYYDEITSVLTLRAEEFANVEMFYYFMGIGSFMSCMVFLLSIYLYYPLCKRKNKVDKDKVKEQNSLLNTPQETAFINQESKKLESKFSERVKFDYIELENIAISKNYFLFIFLPLLALSFLGYIEFFTPVTTAIFNAFVSVPCAFCGFTILLFCVKLIRLKFVKVFCYIFLTIIAIASILFSAVMLILGMLSLAGLILNIRKWILLIAQE